MVRYVLLGLGLVISLIVAYGFVLPGQTQMSQSVEISAPPARVYATLNSISEFNEWSPWAKMEPSARFTYSGPASGLGASMAWDGDVIGRGTLTITSSNPQRIDMALNFEEQGTATAAYTIVPIGPDGLETRVVWSFESERYGTRVLERYIGAFLVAPMLETQYAEGLADLKAYVEAKPADKTENVSAIEGLGFRRTGI